MKKSELISIEFEGFEALETVVAPSLCSISACKPVCAPKPVCVPKPVCPPKPICLPKCY